MALQPSARPAGSSHVLRFTGEIIDTGAVAIATYPKLNGVVPSTIAANVATGVRFLLADATSAATLANPTTQFPAFVFDDSEPAGAAPHAAAAAAAIANITTATDLLITNRTWCQNTYITVEPRNAATAAALVGVDTASAQFCLDTLDSGLGLNTGLPVLILPIISANAFGAWVDLDVDIIIEIRHSASR